MSLTTLIIACHNQARFTRLCVEAVLRQTRPPFELVIVDNASTDETAGYLSSLAGRPGPERVEVLTGATNLGHPAACNLALQRARGEQVVFLDNDVVVTPRWLPRLLGHLAAGGGQAGLVGPVSNAAAGRQQVAAQYARLEDLDGAAERRHLSHSGQRRAARRLSAFCLLARHEALRRLGGFDEQFAHGFFADDDLCLRFREAGLGVVLALDVYVHHFGGATFAGAGVDPHPLLAEGLETFRRKWGPERTAGYRLAPPPAAPGTPCVPAAIHKPRVSLGLIVRDEADNLPACLAGLAGLFDELVVIDTGSGDDTRQVAARLGARVYDFPWVDSFAAARNECLRRARGDYVFWLDADDRVEEGERAKLRALLRSLDGRPVGYLLPCLCPAEAPADGPSVVDHLRLFRNLPGLEWRYRVHEQVLLSFRRLGGQVRRAEVAIRHTGYLSPALRARKLRRDMRLLAMDLEENPDDPFILFNLGWAHLNTGELAKALECLWRSRGRMPTSYPLRAKLFALLAQALARSGELSQALAACQAGRAERPRDGELAFLEAALLHQAGRHADAEARLLALLAARPAGAASGLDLGMFGFKARHNLALVYRAQGRANEEEEQWRAILEERPGSGPAHLGLGELFLRQGRTGELHALLAAAEGREGLGVEAALLRCQISLLAGNAEAALALAERALASADHAPGLHFVRGRAQLLLGRREEAGRSFQRAAALDPLMPEARRQLERLGRP